MGIFKDCFGDLSLENQEKLKRQLNKINKIVGLPTEEERELIYKD